MEIVASYPRADTILLVMDNLSSHNCKAPMDRFDEEIGGPLWERFTVHCAPKYGSRLNHAEIEEIPVARTTASASTGMEPENEPRRCYHQLAVYAHKCTPEGRLPQKQIHTVTDLANICQYYCPSCGQLKS